MTKIRALVVWCIAMVLVACGLDSATQQDEDLGSAESALTATLLYIEVTPDKTSLPAGFTQQFKATGYLSKGHPKNLTSTVVWSVNAGATDAGKDDDAGFGAGTIDPSGVVTTYAPGTLVVTALDPATKMSGSATLTVDSRTIASLTLAPADKNLPIGGMQRMNAGAILSDGSKLPLKGSVLKWFSSAPNVASVDESGVVTGVAPGSTLITFGHIPSGIARSTTLTVDDVTLSQVTVSPGFSQSLIPIGFTEPFSALATFSDGSAWDITSFVSWTSSNAAVATIDAYGVALGVSSGKTTIVAHYRGKTGEYVLNVGDNTLVSIRLAAGWAGPIYVGEPVPLIAYGTFRDGTEYPVTSSVTWSSSNANVFTISNADGEQGLLSAFKAGQAKATATDPMTGAKASAVFQTQYLTVTSLDISTTSAIVATGATQPFTATVTFSDGNTQDVTSQATWSSSNPAVVSVDAAGIATGVAAGDATLTASFVYNKATFTATTPVSVVTLTITSVAIEPPSKGGGMIPVGLTGQARAVAIYNVGPSQDITEAVTWSVTPATFLTVSNAAGTKGLLTALAIGTSTISIVDASGRTASTFLKTQAAVPTAYLFSPTDTAALKTLKVGASYKLTPWARFSDGTTGALPATYRPMYSVIGLKVVSVDPATYTVKALVPGTASLSMLSTPTPWTNPTFGNATVTVTP